MKEEVEAGDLLGIVTFDENDNVQTAIGEH